TRNYSNGGVQHTAATPRVLPANSAPPRGPSLQNAHIPAAAAPMTRVPMSSAYGGARSLPAASFDLARRSSFNNGSRPLPSTAYVGARPAATRSYRASSFANPSIYARRPS